MTNRDAARSLLALPVLFAFLSCTDLAAPTSPVAEPPEAPNRSMAGGKLLSCPSDTVQTVSGNIGVGGGRIGVNGHELLVPKGAISSPQRFQLEVRSSPYLVVSFRAEGHEHFQFTAPVQLTIDYSRCEAVAESTSDLRVFYVDPVTLEVLEDVGGVSDAAANAVVATTEHLSDYAVGSPQ